MKISLDKATSPLWENNGCKIMKEFHFNNSDSGLDWKIHQDERIVRSDCLANDTEEFSPRQWSQYS